AEPVQPGTPAEPVEKVEPESTRRRRRLFFAAGVAVLALGLVLTGIWYGQGQGAGRRTMLARWATTASARTQIGIGNCMLGAVGAACPTSAQCFDALTVSSGIVRARSLPCTKPHTWEVFAIGLLAWDTAAVAYPAVKTDEVVARVCNPAILTL